MNVGSKCATSSLYMEGGTVVPAPTPSLANKDSTESRKLSTFSPRFLYFFNAFQCPKCILENILLLHFHDVHKGSSKVLRFLLFIVSKLIKYHAHLYNVRECACGLFIIYFFIFLRVRELLEPYEERP